MKPLTKYYFLFLLIFAFSVFQSCKDDEETTNPEITITASDFTASIEENPSKGQSLGTIDATTNHGTLTFELTSESPAGAFDLDESSGELSVADETLFDYEINPELTAVITVSNEDISETINVTISLTDVTEGRSLTQVTINGDHFDGIIGHQVVVFDNKIWVIGGYNGEQHTNEIWNSSDGQNWTQVEVQGDLFAERTYHKAVVFNDKIWVIGGGTPADNRQGEVLLNDVWSSSDGETWTQENIEVEHFSGRSFFQATTFDDKMWVLGGHYYTVSADNIWTSTDGKTWELVDPEGQIFSPRWSYSIAVFKGKLWLSGGYVGTDDFGDDIWYSEDGISWTEVTPVGDHFTARELHEMIEFDNKLWVIGGRNLKSHFGDFWYSEDGTTWVRETIKDMPFETIEDQKAVVFNNKLWLIGGMDENGFTNSIYVME